MDIRTAFILTLVSLSLTGEGRKTEKNNCVRLPELEEDILKVGNFWTFHPTTASLDVNLSSVVQFSACNSSSSEVDKKGHHQQLVRVDLVSTTTSSGKFSCQKLKKDSFIQASGVVNTTSTSVTFNHVQGLYYIRLAHCGVTKSGSCKMIKGDDRRVFCIGVDVEDEEEIRKPLKFVAELPKSDDDDICEFEVPTKVSADIVDSSRNINLSSNITYDDVTHDTSGVTRDDQCDINIRVVIPLCTTSRQTHDTVTLTLVDAELGETCTFADFETKEKGDELSDERSTRVTLKPCDNQTNMTSSSLCGDATNAALLDHDVRGLSRNTSYCLFFRLNNPHCQGQFGCVFYTEVISCGLIEGSRRHGYRMQLIVTEPVFIAGVSLTLVASLALLAWTVIQCSKKKPGTPLMTQTQIGMMKKPPRSLTEDDLEHISRLPSQEIVLVYFPDTKRFKDLNRKLRNWLITLDVNDVKDIYDEKATEEVLKNPEQWVRDALAGPEKRIILVCSRLAYECLTAIKRGISSPRFVESDPHFGLLTRTVQYLEREMRGNYRNLICVRYEDLKICSRQYSSEAFNLVPGTEYVLPQHLEDIYRWIHPRQPDPDCWAESRPEVRDLLEAIRQYRHHDDNIFTVQFSAANMVCTPDP